MTVWAITPVASLTEEELAQRAAVIFSDVDPAARFVILVKLPGEEKIRSAARGPPGELGAMLARALEHYSLKARKASN